MYSETYLEIAKLKVAEADAWEKVYGDSTPKCEHCGHELGVSEDAEEAYSNLCKETEDAVAELTKKLIEEGVHIVWTHFIAGESAGLSNYDLEDKVCEKFGDKVMGDSEHSWFVIFTTADVADEVYAYVQKEGGVGSGAQWETYGGHIGEASFNLEKDDNPMIDGLINTTQCREVLKTAKIS